ncbi:MAG: alpha/beta hydrolase-fold protein, partial [Salinimicrobium sp.]
MNLQKCLFWALFLLNFSVFAQSTASPNVSTFEIAAPQLDTIRKIWVYLPENYETSEESYPVLYMHDAQNLFDAATSYSGEWKVDEVLDSLKTPQVIVVGIEHGNDKRIEELTPYPNEKYGGGKADAYVNFLMITLKPHIDATYRTLPDAENTAIMGSSLGGLTSFYAAIKYPETF